MRLICASCHRRWTPMPGRKRTESCPACRKFHLSSAVERAWQRKRLRARTEAIDEPVTDLAAPLDQLMREADAASAKALAAALSISKNRPGRSE